MEGIIQTVSVQVMQQMNKKKQYSESEKKSPCLWIGADF